MIWLRYIIKGALNPEIHASLYEKGKTLFKPSNRELITEHFFASPIIEMNIVSCTAERIQIRQPQS